jgi:TRAP-type transport system small permease protein
MRLPMPDEIKVVVALSVAAALLLTWAMRSQLRVGGQTDLWSIIDAFFNQFFVTLMLVTATLQIAVRFVFAETIALPWTEELARLAMIWAAFWGAAGLHRANDHICLTIVYDMMPPRLKAATLLIGDVLTVAILAPIGWYGFKTAETLDIVSAVSLGLPLSVFAYAVPLGCALMILYSVIRILLWKYTRVAEFGYRHEDLTR